MSSEGKAKEGCGEGVVEILDVGVLVGLVCFSVVAIWWWGAAHVVLGAWFCLGLFYNSKKPNSVVYRRVCTTFKVFGCCSALLFFVLVVAKPGGLGFLLIAFGTPAFIIGMIKSGYAAQIGRIFMGICMVFVECFGQLGMDWLRDWANRPPPRPQWCACLSCAGRGYSAQCPFGNHGPLAGGLAPEKPSSCIVS